MYATPQDIITLYSEDALYVADRDGDGVAEPAALTRALDVASDEINSFLAARYTLPLPVQPTILRQYAVDIALYRLALSRDVLSDEHRRRYDDALAALRDFASGKRALILPQTGHDVTLDTGPRPIVTGGPARLFTRDTLRGM